MRRVFKGTTFLLLAGLFATAPSQAATPAYAPAKARPCHSCVMPMLPVALPRQGLVLAQGSFMGDGSTWYLLDLQAAEATRIEARLDRATNRLSIAERVSRSLLPGELSALTQLANRIWASQEALLSMPVRHVTWDLWLLDGLVPRLREMMGENGIALGNATGDAGMPDGRLAQGGEQPRAGATASRFDSRAAVAHSARVTTLGERGMVDTFA
jgi:hypothetical protein